MSGEPRIGVRGLEAVTLYVEDLDHAKHFYGGVLGLRAEEIEDDFASYRVGAASLELHPSGEPFPGVVLGRQGPGVAVQITLEVEDVEAAVAYVRAEGSEVFQEPKDRPWGKRDAGVHDPDGNEVYFSQPIAPYSTTPPAGASPGDAEG